MQQHADVVIDLKGNVIKGASVRVLLLDGTLATIYAANGGAPTINPIPTGQKGEFAFFAQNGDYMLEISAGGKVLGTQGPVKLYDVLDDGDAARLSSLAADDGSSKIGFILNAAGAVARKIADILAERISVTKFIPAGVDTATTNCTPYFQAAADYAESIGGAFVRVPAGTFLLGGLAAGPDGKKSGFILHDTGSDFTTNNGVQFVGEGVNTRLLAGSDDMIVVRSSRVYSGVRNLLIDGNGHVGVWAGGVVPEDMTQITQCVSQSFQRWDIYVENCDEGVVVMPGPTVSGSDSGCFYHDIRVHSNTVKRAIWTKADITGANNRPTRSKFVVVPMRGNTGVQIDAGSELDIDVRAEMINTGTSPNASPVAVLVSNNNTANIRVRGYAEACTRGLVALDPTAVESTGWGESGAPDSSNSFITSLKLGRALIGKRATEAAQLVFGNPSFVRFTADKAGANAKNISLFINDVEKDEWASDGSKTFHGSVGNVKYEASGAGISFSRAGTNLISARTAGGSLYFSSDAHGWTKADGTEILTLSATEWIPRVTNLSLGIPGYTFASVATKNIILSPPASATPANNGEMTFQLTSNTSLAVKVKGSDGVVRSATLTLA